MDINYLLNIQTSLTDDSDYHRNIIINGATESGDGIFVSNNKTFYTPYSNDIVKWNTEGYTFEMDVFPLTTMVSRPNTRHGNIVCNGNNPGNIDYWSFGIESGNVIFYYWGGTQRAIAGPSTVPLNSWSTIKFQYKQGTISIYLNGVQEGAMSIGAYTPQYSSSYNLVFMCYQISQGCYIRNIRIYIDEN